jgi:hypothetical protein
MIEIMLGTAEEARGETATAGEDLTGFVEQNVSVTGSAQHTKGATHPMCAGKSGPRALGMASFLVLVLTAWPLEVGPKADGVRAEDDPSVCTRLDLSSLESRRASAGQGW